MVINRLTPAATLTTNEIDTKFPRRVLDTGAHVTRIAPSPTGFMHIGGIYTALISALLSRQSNGVFFLRIEDTDKKREVAGAVDLIISSLKTFKLSPDEGPLAPGEDFDRYGPYSQSERTDIYQHYVRRLLANGDAYPCFATLEELERARSEQTNLKKPPGYYGRWATWRDRNTTDVEDALAEGKPFVIRLRTPNDLPKQIVLPDLIRGDLELKPNDQDVVLLKADGTPTYHLAHVIDDHLMGTTHVIRGSEWIASYPLHAQLFALLDWPRPHYAHISPIEKLEGSSRRKLSKRNDPEASISFYMEQGYPVESIIDYLMTLADSRFEAWRTENPSANINDFPFDLSHMGRSGALFDIAKLDNISRDRIGRMSAPQVYEALAEWASKYDSPLADLLAKNRDYSTAILNIERNRERARKDIAKWSDATSIFSIFFDHLFEKKARQIKHLLTAQQPAPPPEMFEEIAATYDISRSHEDWLACLRAIGQTHGYALNAKTFKKAPDTYRGHFADLAASLRLALCGTPIAPDLYEVMQVLGAERITKRLTTHLGRRPEPDSGLGDRQNRP